MKSFFIMDENFLLQKRARHGTAGAMKAAGKSWTFNIFSSANAIAKYTYEELVEIGIASIWLGLESPHSNYSKLDGADTLKLTRELREHGIVLLGSTIIGLEHHTPENINEEIEHAIAHETDLHQFMLYTPVPGTPLYPRWQDRAGCSMWTWPTFTGSTRSTSSTRRSRASESDPIAGLGVSSGISNATARACSASAAPPSPAGSGTRTIRTRACASASGARCRTLRHAWVGLLWAMEHRLNGSNPEVAAKIRALRKEMEQEFGLVAIAAGKLLGPVLWWTSRREEKRLAAGQCYEPATIIDRRNWVHEPAPAAPSPAVYRPRRLAPELISLEPGKSSSGD